MIYLQEDGVAIYVHHFVCVPLGVFSHHVYRGKAPIWCYFSTQYNLSIFDQDFMSRTYNIQFEDINNSLKKH